MFQLFKSILLVLVFFFVIGVASKAQNLVPNPSFEIYSQCPFDVNQVHFATGWTSYRETPEYFNSCNSGLYSVPCNVRGCQYAATGEGYCSLGGTTYFPNFREFIGIELLNSLIIGQTYHLKVKINLSDYTGINCASNKFGMRLSTVQYNFLNPAPIDNFAHVFSSIIVSDTTNWTVIEGDIIADSAYTFLCIGIFYDDANIDTSNCGMGNSIFNYYVDDVCVAVDSLDCVNFSSIGTQNSTIIYNIHSNPISNSLIISANSNEHLDFQIYKYSGELVLSGSFINNENINVEAFSTGIYILKILSRKSTQILKLVKI